MCRALCLGIGDITVDQPGMAMIHLFPLLLSPKSKLSSPLSWTAVRASTWPSHVRSCSLVVYSKHRNYVTPRLKHLSRLSGLLRIKAEVGDRTPRDLCLPHRHVVSCHRLPHALLQSCRLSGCFSNKPVMLLPRGLQGRYTPCSLSPSVLTPDTHVASPGSLCSNISVSLKPSMIPRFITAISASPHASPLHFHFIYTLHNLFCLFSLFRMYVL